MISFLAKPWRALPRDAFCTILVAALMPVAMQSYHVAPALAHLLGIEQVQDLARAIFSVSIAVGCVMVSWLIESSHAHHGLPLPWRNFIGHTISAAALVTGAFAIYALQAPLLDTLNQGMSWRAMAGLEQVILVVAWMILWGLRRPSDRPAPPRKGSWMSRSIARVTALVSAVGLGLYVIANFLVADPLTQSWGWGVIQPRSLVARITGTPLIEPALAIVLWGSIALLLRRFWRRLQDHGSGHLRRQ